MRRLVPVLSATTLIFAASTAYLARALYLERARIAADSSAAATAATPVARDAGRTASNQAAANTETTPRPAAGPGSERVARQAPPVDLTSGASPDPAKRLAQYSDPAQRAAMLEERKNSYRTFYPGLAEHLHMDETEFENFIEAVGRGELDMQETHLRCYIEKSCDSHVLSGLVEAQKRALTDLFGTETLEAFDFFRETTSERRTVSELRARLPDKLRLLDAQSEALIGALYEETQRIRKDAQQRHVNLSTYNSLVYTPEPGAPDDADGWQIVNEYNRMLRDRAATILTPDQLAVYEKMQQNALQGFRSMRIQTNEARASSQAN